MEEYRRYRETAQQIYQEQKSVRLELRGGENVLPKIFASRYHLSPYLNKMTDVILPLQEWTQTSWTATWMTGRRRPSSFLSTKKSFHLEICSPLRRWDRIKCPITKVSPPSTSSMLTPLLFCLQSNRACVEGGGRNFVTDWWTTTTLRIFRFAHYHLECHHPSTPCGSTALTNIAAPFAFSSEVTI